MQKDKGLQRREEKIVKQYEEDTKASEKQIATPLTRNWTPGKRG
jgi:hypothetical protein